MHQELNWHPARTNPLRVVGQTFYFPDGRKCVIGQHMAGGFYVDYTDEAGNRQRAETGSNLRTCYWLNQRQVGSLR